MKKIILTAVAATTILFSVNASALSWGLPSGADISAVNMQVGNMYAAEAAANRKAKADAELEAEMQVMERQGDALIDETDEACVVDGAVEICWH